MEKNKDGWYEVYVTYSFPKNIYKEYKDWLQENVQEFEILVVPSNARTLSKGWPPSASMWPEGFVVRLKNEEDATAFKLRWC